MIKREILSRRIISYLRILFCVGFFLLCIIPIGFLNKKLISEQENRELMALPSLWVDGKINEKFYDQYEVYLKDHFPGRLGFIKLYYHLQYAIQNRIENEKAFVLDDGWMFSFYRTRDNNIGTQQWVFNKIKERIENFVKYVQTKPIDIYFFIVPDRTQIYRQKWEKYYANRRHISMGDEIKKNFSSYPNIEVFFPRDKLESLSKKEDVFWKHDIHLYGKAGLQPLVYDFVELLQRKYFPNAIEYPKIIYGQEEDANAHYADILFLDMKRQMTSYKPVLGEYFSVEDNLYDGMSKTAINEKALSDKSVLVVGNCYAELTFAQLREIFHRAVLWRYNSDKRIKATQKLSLADIDIIVIAVAEDNMDDMLFLDTLRTML